MNGRLTIERAGVADYGAILAENAAAVPSVNLIDEAALAALHDQAFALLAARDADQAGSLAGFLLALPERADYASPNFRFFQARFDAFVYVDRIVVSPDYRRHGVGRLLYRALFELSPSTRVTCEVNLKPPNPESMAFHAGLGFRTVGEQDTEGGSKRVALLVRDPGAAP